MQTLAFVPNGVQLREAMNKNFEDELSKEFLYFVVFFRGFCNNQKIFLAAHEYEMVAVQPGKLKFFYLNNDQFLEMYILNFFRDVYNGRYYRSIWRLGE